ncbi:malic enzyme-like NAD(P)-binding protein [Desulfoplanes formicivorans]|uniref:Malate dehydrogenase n=1 Tax=Desulfoplanes formicivorans TaxID=1592317 RepID=A0A194AKS2_9BACT|nr:malic enzyme-like NAD(P)-binding protein [Desulfoplanes formicivorans]GAU09913.1 malate dehydrogenase [Desulfoplanes formicivorans]
MALFTNQEALDYHSQGRKGKLEVIPVKPCATQKHLSLAYTPGVAQACLAIKNDPSRVYDYTNKANLVAVVSNGTAVLGLGNIGPMAGKPVMEGKGVLFKVFADVDVYDINVNQPDPDKIIELCTMLEPTFGGINLEDIKAPECFYIEEKLIESLNIPVFHDDQHGTAIISGAALVNALELSNKKAEDIKVVVSGAGAAAIACAKFYQSLGVRNENIYMYDSRGLIYKGRDGMNPYKALFAQDKDYGTMEEVIKGADLFLGVSVKDILSQDMVKSMADQPIIFAMANPDPEITFDAARQARPDCIMGTGRSDYPNQINNVSGFPFIFRGALDVRASTINEEMKIAAAKALAKLAKEPIPQEVLDAYGMESMTYGPDYILPKPLDPRLILHVAPAVAQAAIDSGVARITLDMDAYVADLETRMRASQQRIQTAIASYDLEF